MTFDSHVVGLVGRFAAGCRSLAVPLPLMFLAVSCISAEPEAKKTGQQKQQCESTRESALDKAKPEVLGIRSRTEDVVSGLNDWQQECLKGGKTRGVIGAEAEKLLARAWKPEEIKRFKQGYFDDRDAYHLRNSLLFGAIRREISKRTADRNNERQQVLDLFSFVVRSVELVDKHPNSLPMPIFRVLLRGKGTAADRAWLFASLLRQLEVPSVILSPKEPAKRNQFVVGVLLEVEKKIYLFDPQLGIPLPAPQADANSPYITTPATLKQFLSNPSIAKSLSTPDHPYPLKPRDLAKPRVQLIGHRSVWAPHMKDLYVPMHTRCIVYINLEDKTQGDGLIDRVSQLGKPYWTKDDLEIWPYPGRIFSDYAALKPEQRSRMNALFRSFTAPRPVTVEKTGGKQELVIGNPTHRQFQSRVLHLTGSYKKSIEGYVYVRREAFDFKGIGLQDNTTRQMYDAADDDADFWIGVGQYEHYRRMRREKSAAAVDSLTRDRLKDAISSLGGYVGRTASRKSPRWIDQSHFLHAVCQVEKWSILRSDPETEPKDLERARRNAADALRKLKSVPRQHPQKAGFELIRLRMEQLLSRAQAKPRKPPRKADKKPVVAPRPKPR